MNFMALLPLLFALLVFFVHSGPPTIRVSSLQFCKLPCNLPYFIDPRFQECTFIMIPNTAQETQGHWKVHKNIDLARRAQKLWACARHFFHVEFVWVKGHTLGKQQQVQDMPLGP